MPRSRPSEVDSDVAGLVCAATAGEGNENPAGAADSEETRVLAAHVERVGPERSRDAVAGGDKGFP